MKLLFDENLSPELPKRLSDVFPGSAHVRDLGLKGADDDVIWSKAGGNGFLLVTKDDDFIQISVLRGVPPKLILIGLGNCPTSAIVTLLRSNLQKIEAFECDTASSFLELS